MNISEVYDKVKNIENKIADLPTGYISRKNINGTIRYYHQWTENGKLKSKYLRDGEAEELAEKINHRKELQAELKELKKRLPKENRNILEFETNVTTGKALLEMTKSVEKWQKRDSFAQLQDYLSSDECDRVCLVYGLRRTGKTTMLRQAIGEMTADDISKTVYIKAKSSDTMAMMNRDLKMLRENGYKYVFIDEVTLMSDFIDSAALFSDVFAAMGMKIVLSGTESLGFWLAMDEELYDRAKLIHTTFIPFREYSRLLGVNSIDEYIRYGGTLRAGEISFDDADVNAEDASFRDDESTRRYIDTAISKNIQHSLTCYQDGGHFRHLQTLHQAGELTGAINRIIEDMNHRFLLEVLTKDFVSGDLRLTAKNLRKERDPEKRTDALDNINTENVTANLMRILEIRNNEDRKIGIENEHVLEIKEYLKSLDLIVDCPIEIAETGVKTIEHILFTQPGMRYCQAQALVYSLMQDESFLMLREKEKTIITERILEEVRGRMMGDIVLLEASKAFDKRYKVFKLQFERGEYDMVIYDKVQDCCAAYEIKHSKEAVPEQARHLNDSDKIRQTERRFGDMIGRYVIYRGEDFKADNDIQYLNVEKFLNTLPEFAMNNEQTANQYLNM